MILARLDSARRVNDAADDLRRARDHRRKQHHREDQHRNIHGAHAAPGSISHASHEHLGARLIHRLGG